MPPPIPPMPPPPPPPQVAQVCEVTRTRTDTKEIVRGNKPFMRKIIHRVKRSVHLVIPLCGIWCTEAWHQPSEISSEARDPYAKKEATHSPKSARLPYGSLATLRDFRK